MYGGNACYGICVAIRGHISSFSSLPHVVRGSHPGHERPVGIFKIGPPWIHLPLSVTGVSHTCPACSNINPALPFAIVPSSFSKPLLVSSCACSIPLRSHFLEPVHLGSLCRLVKLPSPLPVCSGSSVCFWVLTHHTRSGNSWAQWAGFKDQHFPQLTPWANKLFYDSHPSRPLMRETQLLGGENVHIIKYLSVQ